MALVNKKQQTFKGISKRAKALLTREEGYDVDFKKTIDGLDVEDYVAFANSESGGSILIGVEEIRTNEGRKTGKGQIVGCKVDDEAKRKIIDKAESCVPPVHIDLFVENSNGEPFYRIEIPSGDHKPYSTFKGIYKIRGDGRTNPLLPNRLLTLFLEIESQKFIEKFQSATQELGNNLIQINSLVTNEFAKILRNIRSMEIQIENSLESISSDAQDAQINSDEANSEVQDVAYSVSEVHKKLDSLENGLEYIEANVIHLLSHFNIEDEKGRIEREQMVFWFKIRVEQIRHQRPRISKKKLLEELTKHYPNTTIQNLIEIYDTIYDDSNKRAEQ